jgi:hypothetical protein
VGEGEYKEELKRFLASRRFHPGSYLTLYTQCRKEVLVSFQYIRVPPVLYRILYSFYAVYENFNLLVLIIARYKSSNKISKSKKRRERFRFGSTLIISIYQDKRP